MKLQLITEQHTGAPGRAFFAGTDRIQVEGIWKTKILFDTDPKASIPMEPELIEATRRHCIGVTYLAYTTDGPYLEEGEQAPTQDDRRPVQASLDDVKFYRVDPVCTPDGRLWVLRFPETTGLANQSVFALDPLGVLRVAEERHLLQFATPLPVEPAPVVVQAP